MSWLIPLLELIGKPALILVLKWLEGKYPGIGPLLQKIIDYLNGAENQPEAMAKLHAHFDSFCCPSDVVKG